MAIESYVHVAGQRGRKLRAKCRLGRSQGSGENNKQTRSYELRRVSFLY